MARTNRELVMLAETYEKGRDRVAGMFLSEKLDGMRALWLPHTRGIPVKDLPFANREKDKREHVATGLWSRLCKPIFCPDFFLEGFPSYPLDGEIHAGRGKFQDTISAVRKLEPVDEEWYPLEYRVFDAPTYDQVFTDGRINNPHWSKTIKKQDCLAALNYPEDRKAQPFEFTIGFLLKEELHKKGDHIYVHPQRMLPFNTPLALDEIDQTLEKILSEGGEGLILRYPASFWEPIRSRQLLKVVPVNDAEATILGFTAGEGKLLGVFGSAVVRWDRGTFKLSGFTDEERRLTPAFSSWAAHNPGRLLSECPLPIDDEPAVHFKVGDVITFSYKELTSDGVPKSGRYKRKA